MNEIFQLLNPSNTLTVNRLLAHAVGALETIIYGALIAKFNYYEKNNMLDDGWFYSTVPDLEESTSLSEYQQKRCIANLVKAGLIETKNRGLPAKRSFRVIQDIETLSRLLFEGEEKISLIKPTAAQSYEKKRKGADEASFSDFSPCSEETAEQAPKKLDLLLQRNCGASSEEIEVSYFNKSKGNKTKDKNHLSINQTGEADRIDMIDENPKNQDFVSLGERAGYLEIIRENIEYDYLIENYPTKKGRIDEIVGIMLDVVCSKREYIRVNGEDFPREVVKSQFLKLNEGHIDYVITALDKSASDIRNIRAYLITALYNAPLTIDSFYSAMVNHDMYGINGAGTHGKDNI